jgi:hypothetical protein
MRPSGFPLAIAYASTAPRRAPTSALTADNSAELTK